MKIISFNEIKKLARESRRRVAVIAPNNKEIIFAINEANKENIIKPILIGDKKEIEKSLLDIGTKATDYEIINVNDPEKATKKAVQLVNDCKADLLMKGIIETGVFYKTIFEEKRLKTKERACSVAAIESNVLDRVILLADVGINIYPNVEEKASIIRNCIKVARILGVNIPKIAVLASINNVSEKIASTIDADELAKMNKNGFFRNSIVEGPISLDTAVNKRASKIKKYSGKIKGNADILIAPDLQVSNILIKGLMFMTSGIRIAGIGLGLKIPTIVTTRSDTVQGIFYSISLASLISKSLEKIEE